MCSMSDSRMDNDKNLCLVQPRGGVQFPIWTDPLWTSPPHRAFAFSAASVTSPLELLVHVLGVVWLFGAWYTRPDVFHRPSFARLVHSKSANMQVSQTHPGMPSAAMVVLVSPDQRKVR